MPLADVLLGLKAMFVEEREAPDRAALLAARAPGLRGPERARLLALEASRVDVYTGLVREGIAAMLEFVAPGAVDAAATFAATPRGDLAREMLVHTPRRTSRSRELAQRLVDHLEGPGAAIVSRCPPILDLARLERENTEVFYAPDDDAWSPGEFAARAASETVDRVLAFVAKPAAATRTLTVRHDVLTWRTRRFESGHWDAPPPLLGAPRELLAARDPATLQPGWQRLEPAVLDVVRPSADRSSVDSWRPVETYAERWLAATGASPDDPDAAARFFESFAAWVRSGVLVVREGSATA